jgi:hypothetical protein
LGYVGRLQRSIDTWEGEGDEALSGPVGTMDRKTTVLRTTVHRMEMKL